MTSSDPEILRRQIESTRRELSYDVDALNEKVNPARATHRRVAAARNGLTRAKDAVMGSAEDATSAAMSSASDTVTGAPEAVSRQTRGNPLAAGLIAFGAGWLMSSLLPASRQETRLAQQAESAVREHKDTLLEPARQAAQELREELQPAAEQAVEEVRSTAQDATATVRDEGRSAAQEVQGQAQQSKETVQSHATGP